MWSLAAMEKSARVELFFCAPTAETNQTRFVAMLAHKDEIEKNFGEPLLWDFKDGRKQQYLRSRFPMGGLEEESKRKAIQDDLIDRLIKMEAAMKGIIKQLD